MQGIITVKNLIQAYADGTKAIDDISFYVKEGEFFGFLGPNGARNSTTIKRALLENSYYSLAERGYV